MLHAYPTTITMLVPRRSVTHRAGEAILAVSQDMTHMALPITYEQSSRPLRKELPWTFQKPSQPSSRPVSVDSSVWA